MKRRPSAASVFVICFAVAFLSFCGGFYAGSNKLFSSPSPSLAANDLTLLPTVAPAQKVSRAAATSAPRSTDYQYIGNKNSDIFHKPSCSSVRLMNESNKVFLKSRQEAVNKGYRACQRCHP